MGSVLFYFTAISQTSKCTCPIVQVFKLNIIYSEFQKQHIIILSSKSLPRTLNNIDLSSWSPISFPSLPTLYLVHCAFLVSYMPPWSLGSPMPVHHDLTKLQSFANLCKAKKVKQRKGHRVLPGSRP